MNCGCRKWNGDSINQRDHLEECIDNRGVDKKEVKREREIEIEDGLIYPLGMNVTGGIFDDPRL